MIVLDPLWSGNPILQRDASGIVRPIFKGSFDGSGNLEARIRKFDGSVYVDWIGIPHAAAWECDMAFPAIGQWMALDVRAAENHADTVSSSWFGSGDVWILSGQSNAERFVGLVTGTSVRTAPGALYVPDDAEAMALCGESAGWSTTFGASLGVLTNAISAATGLACGVLFMGRGGFPMCVDSEASAGAYLLCESGDIADFPSSQFLTKCVNMLSECGSGGFAGAIFIGHEADAIATPSDSLWLGLNKWWASLSGTIKRPCVVSRVGTCGTLDTGRIRDVETAWCEVTPGAYAGASRQGYALESDGLNVHLTSGSLMTFANCLKTDVLAAMTM